MSRGAICGCLPRFVALRRGRPGLAYGALAVCTAAGALGGLLLAVLAALVLTAIVFAVPRRRGLGRGWSGRQESDASTILGVVGGLEVDAPEFVSAVRIVFVRLGNDQRPDPADSYSSEWLGEPSGQPTQTIQSNGAKVIGVCGRRAAVVDAIGLVLE